MIDDRGKLSLSPVEEGAADSDCHAEAPEGAEVVPADA
jgi:hypothetical protein